MRARERSRIVKDVTTALTEQLRRNGGGVATVPAMPENKTPDYQIVGRVEAEPPTATGILARLCGLNASAQLCAERLAQHAGHHLEKREGDRGAPTAVRFGHVPSLLDSRRTSETLGGRWTRSRRRSTHSTASAMSAPQTRRGKPQAAANAANI